MIIPTLTMIIIPSSDTARHSATSGSLDLSIHNTEVQVVVFLTHWCRVLSGDCLEAIYYIWCDKLLSIFLSLSSETNFILFHLFSLFYTLQSVKSEKVGTWWYRCWTPPPPNKVGAKSFLQRLHLVLEHIQEQSRLVKGVSCKPNEQQCNDLGVSVHKREVWGT